MNEREAVFGDAVVTEILWDRLHTTIVVELGIMVDEGLLEMGINDDGEAVYWPTELGEQVLGMDLV